MGSQVQDGCPAEDRQRMCNSRFRDQGCEQRVEHGPGGDGAVAQHREGAMHTQSPKSHLVLDLEHVVHAERLLRSVAPHVLPYHLVQLLSKRLCQAICQSLSHDVGVIVTRLPINAIAQRVSTQQERPSHSGTAWQAARRNDDVETSCLTSLNLWMMSSRPRPAVQANMPT